MKAEEREDALSPSLLNRRISWLSSTLDSVGCGIITVSLEGKVLSYNQEFLQMWQVPESMHLDLDSEECSSFFTQQLASANRDCQFFWQVPNQVTDKPLEILELKDGRVFVQSSKLQRVGTEIVGIVWSIWDNTEFKKLIEQPKVGLVLVNSDTALEEARAIGELKTRFLSSMCHQFRSFLNIISFSNSLLKVKQRDAERSQINYLNNIQTAVEQISTLLDRLIFLGQSEVGRVAVQAKPTDIASFCRVLTAQIEPMSRSKQQDLKFTCADNLKIVCIDTDIVEQISINLLCNAFRYTPEGGQINFRVSHDREKLILQVQDTGIGILATEQQRIFEPFYRGSNTKETLGTGLGLAIVKNLVKIYDGSIQVDSREGMGTTFTVILPAEISTI